LKPGRLLDRCLGEGKGNGEGECRSLTVRNGFGVTANPKQQKAKPRNRRSLTAFGMTIIEQLDEMKK